MDKRLEQIRDSERQSHMETYTAHELYQEGSWLSRPIKSVRDLLPLFRDYRELHVLDLGCGVGRNCIHIAQRYRDIPCSIDCVDILDLAIEKLYSNAEKYEVTQNIRGTVCPIEKYPVREEYYDLLLAVSALEHVDSEGSFSQKLQDMRNGARENGIICLVINSQVEETDRSVKARMPAQFEVNLPTEKLLEILRQTFADWTVLKSSVQVQQYDIPREWGTASLTSHVVSFVARKCQNPGGCPPGFHLP